MENYYSKSIFENKHMSTVVGEDSAYVNFISTLEKTDGTSFDYSLPYVRTILIFEI